MKCLRYFLSLVVVLSTWQAFAQQRPIISQYMFNQLVINPAYAGRDDYTSFNAVYRSQWVNVPGAPELGSFTAQTGFKDRPIGVGLMLASDRIGVHNNMFVYGSYAYNIRMQNGGKLALGLQAGFNYLTSDFNQLDILDQDDPYLSGQQTKFLPNFGTGLYYHDAKNYVGVSVPYILSNKRIREGDFYRDVRIDRNYYISAGRLIDIGPRIILKPSMLLRLGDNMPIGYDLNVNFYFDEIVGFGGSYRSGDSFTILFEMWVNRYLKFGYAYDYVISDIGGFTKGTHELMLRYRVNFNAPRKDRMCPGPLYF